MTMPTSSAPLLDFSSLSSATEVVSKFLTCPGEPRFRRRSFDVQPPPLFPVTVGRDVDTGCGRGRRMRTAARRPRRTTKIRE